MSNKTFKIKPIISKLRETAIYFLILYLLLFSVFALYHVYAANELDDSHGCAIGEWVHLGQQAAVSFLLLFSVYLLLYLPHKNTTIFLKRTLLWKNHLKRGPPLLFLTV